MTNKEWLATLPAEQFYDEFKKIEQKMRFDINTRLAMIEWLDEEHQEKVIKHINELLAKDCFDGNTDTKNVKRVLREVLELLNAC